MKVTINLVPLWAKVLGTAVVIWMCATDGNRMSYYLLGLWSAVWILEAVSFTASIHNRPRMNREGFRYYEDDARRALNELGEE